MNYKRKLSFGISKHFDKSCPFIRQFMPFNQWLSQSMLQRPSRLPIDIFLCVEMTAFLSQWVTIANLNWPYGQLKISPIYSIGKMNHHRRISIVSIGIPCVPMNSVLVVQTISYVSVLLSNKPMIRIYVCKWSMVKFHRQSANMRKRHARSLHVRI